MSRVNKGKRKQYGWNFLGEGDVWEAPFNSVAECLKAARETLGHDDGVQVFIGEALKYTPTVDVESMLVTAEIDLIDDTHDTNIDLFNPKKKYELVELHENINKVFCAWLSKYGYMPDIYIVPDSKCYLLTKQD